MFSRHIQDLDDKFKGKLPREKSVTLKKSSFQKVCSVTTANMSGFRRGHSCCSALLILTDDWRQALDSKKDVAVVAIDLSKAFDSICHNILLAKLKAFGVHDSAIKPIQSYL